MQATCCDHGAELDRARAELDRARAELDRVYAALLDALDRADDCAAGAAEADARAVHYAAHAAAVIDERNRAYQALAAAHEDRRIVTPEELAG